MQKPSTVQLNILISKEHHDLLVTLAAERNLCNPDAGATKGGIARELLREALRDIPHARGRTDG